MSAVFTEQYQTFNAYLCKSPANPAGIKYPDAVSLTGIITRRSSGGQMSISSGNIDLSAQSFFHAELAVTVLMYKDGYEEYPADVYMLPVDKDIACLLNTPANAVDGSGSDASWSRDTDLIIVKLPELLQCGTNGIMVMYSETQFSQSDVAHIGEITSTSPKYTFNRDGHFLLDVSLNTTQLIPGYSVYVFYRLDGIDDWFLLGTFSFQTDIFAAATVTGCALCDKVKVYNNPYKPEDGYTYQYKPVVGGIGQTMQPEWLYDTRLRWSVSFYGQTYWLQAIAPCLLNVGKRVTILKGVENLPYTPDPNLASGMVKRELAQTTDRIAPDHFYEGLI